MSPAFRAAAPTCACACALLGLAPAAARGADLGVDAGALAAILSGTHVGSDNPYPVAGVVPGAALEIVAHADRVRLHLEGIPTVAAAGSATGAFGRSSASLSLLNATLLVDVDRQRRFRLGGGYQIVNLANTNGVNGDRNRVRIASPIYAAGATLPLPAGHFVDLDVMVDPNLRGVLNVYDVRGVAYTNKPERGAEVDYAAAYGWRRGDVTYRLGARALSYHTRNLDNGELVDRNVGGGATFDVRFALGRR
jgi:hypothetical protein